jgi:hypothetical protein
MDIAQSILGKMEEDRLRTVVVFASSMACAEALLTFLRSDHGLLLHLALLQEGTGLSPRIIQQPTLYELVKKADIPNWLTLYPSLSIDPALLLSASRLIWFRNHAELTTSESGAWSCAVNVGLGMEYGLSVSCFDAQGRSFWPPFDAALDAMVDCDLKDWWAHHRAYTDRIRAEGLVLAYDHAGTLLWSAQGGSIDAGSLDLPPTMTRRVRQMEHWMRFQPLKGAWTDDAEYDAFDAELQQLADDLAETLGTTVKLYDL